MNSKKLKHTAFRFLFLFFFPMVVMAQDADDPFADDTQDVPAAPIDDYIVMALVIAICIAIYFFRKQYNYNKEMNKNEFNSITKN
ncbi:hypothetical protein [Flavobacterium eburneipallidum]|uniref:hypothetical protein n=1 Tax=Flavobacterium eburneipallidum TaxID=3003263 RepID=UPI00248287C8|nr:hypothetical protein [Flavobacterium eburneipallidum]